MSTDMTDIARCLLGIVERELAGTGNVVRNLEPKTLLSVASQRLGDVMKKMVEFAESGERIFTQRFQKLLHRERDGSIYNFGHLEYGEFELSVQASEGYGCEPDMWLPLAEYYASYSVAIIRGGDDGQWIRPSDLGMDPALDEEWHVLAPHSWTSEAHWKGTYVPAGTVQQIVDFLDPVDVCGFGAGR